MHRRTLLKLFAAGGAGLVLGCRRCEPVAPALSAMRRGVAWLLDQQEPDGAIPSQVYGFLRGGQSTTAIAVDTLTALPAAAAVPPAPVASALRWMLDRRIPEGALGLAEPAPDYPVYATALMIRGLATARPPGWADAAAASVAWLRGQQLTAARGFSPPGLGGFPMGARDRPEPGVALHVDLSMTRRAIEALRAAGATDDDPAIRAAKGFVERCATTDGGFLYSPVEPMVNKGVRTDATDASGLAYGSATADGVLALRACGDGSSAASALAWLRIRHRVDANPGVGDGPYAAFGPAMRFYYRAAAARVFAGGGGPDGWRDALVAALLDEQRPDGSWRSEHAAQKEDEPIIATSLALRALAAAVR